MCVEGNIEVTQEDDPSLLEVTRGNKVYELIPFCEDGRRGRVRFHVCTDYRGASKRCADVEGVPALVLVVGWFAYPSVEPTFVEECNNSPAFTLMATVG